MAGKTIGEEGSAKGKQCVYCSEPFGFQEFSSYMLKIWSKHIVCFACLKSNYLEPSKNLALRIILLFAALCAGLVFFLGLNLMVAIDSYNENDGSFQIVWLVVAIGIFGGLAITKYLMAVFRWFTGTMVQENIDKL